MSHSPVRQAALFEDEGALRLGPLVLNRPVFDLVLGAVTLRRRLERALGLPVRGASVRPHLAALAVEEGLATADDPALEGALWVNAAVAPGATGLRADLLGLTPGELLCATDGRLLAFRPRPGDSPRLVLESALGGLSAGTGSAEPGRGSEQAASRPRPDYAARTLSHAALLVHAWDLIGGHEPALLADLEELAQAFGSREILEPGAQIETLVQIDTRRGPVVVRAGAEVQAYSRLEGPLLIESGARVLGGRVSSSVIGPGCRVRGEVESSVFLGWSNKAHDGFVGHSYLGAWVNLGALTTTSDLKNNYGAVRMHENGRMESTGLMKVGSVVADHVKTAIGTLLGTGTVVGLGANLFGAAGPAPAWVAPFAWGVGPRADAYDLERFLATAHHVATRRGQALSAGRREALVRAFDISRAERDAWLCEQASPSGA